MGRFLDIGLMSHRVNASVTLTDVAREPHSGFSLIFHFHQQLFKTESIDLISIYLIISKLEYFKNILKATCISLSVDCLFMSLGLLTCQEIL